MASRGYLGTELGTALERWNGGPRWWLLGVQVGWLWAKVEGERRRLHTERVIRDWLSEHDVEVYLPMLVDKVVLKGKTHIVERPLYRGYMFVRFDPTTPIWDVVHHRRAVMGIQHRGERAVSVSQADIDYIRGCENGHGCLTKEAARAFNLKAYVRVLEGPFTSFNGPVIELRGPVTEPRYVVELNVFGRPTPVELPESALASAASA